MTEVGNRHILLVIVKLKLQTKLEIDSSQKDNVSNSVLTKYFQKPLPFS